MTEKKLFIQQRYNEQDYVESYDFRYRSIQFLKLNILKEKLDSLAGLILDDGTGTGLVWEWINENFDNNPLKLEPKENLKTQSTSKIFIGIDISLEMLRCFRIKLRSNQQNNRNNNNEINQKPYFLSPKNVHILCADAENLPFRPDIFDSVFAMTILQNLPNLEQGLQEIKRVRKCQNDNGNTQIGISFLKKTLTISELNAKIYKNLGPPCFLDPPKDEFGRIIENEDYLCVVKE